MGSLLEDILFVETRNNKKYMELRTCLQCARARKWNGFSRKVERSSQLMERLMAHEFSQNGTALAPIWNDPLSNRDAPVILSQWNGNP